MPTENSKHPPVDVEDGLSYIDYRYNLTKASFKKVLRKAYKDQFGRSRNKDIAEHAHLSYGRVSQVLKAPQDIDRASLESFLSPIESPSSRKLVIKAWLDLKWPDILEAERATEIATPPITKKTIESILQMMRAPQHQFVAMNAARIAFDRSEDVEHRKWLLVILRQSHLRLANFGRAMYYARLSAEFARQHGDVLMEARSHLFRAQVLLKMGRTSLKSVNSIVSIASDLVEPLTANDLPGRNVARFKRVQLPLFRMDLSLLEMESGQAKVDASKLSAFEQELHKMRSLFSDDGYDELMSAVYNGRIQLLRGNLFKAYEASDAAYKIQDVKRLASGLSICSRLRSQIIEADKDRQATEHYLLESIKGVESLGDFYSSRMIEYQLAELENSMFARQPL